MSKIEVKGLSKAYSNMVEQGLEGCPPGQVILKDISFQVKERSFTCFVGPSGCGKSTLLRIIAGFDPPTSGTVLIDGKPVEAPSSKHIFVFQEDGLFPWMTTYENVAIGARWIEDKVKRHEQVMEYLELVGIDGFEHHYPHELSGGMRRRAEVARALITNPDLLFMDEPFSALDFMTRMHMREEMINVHTMFDTTILFITHDIDEALQLGDQIIVLSERPTEIKADITLDFPHPRDLGSGPLAKIRREIYFLMGLHAAL